MSGSGHFLDNKIKKKIDQELFLVGVVVGSQPGQSVGPGQEARSARIPPLQTLSAPNPENPEENRSLGIWRSWAKNGRFSS
jgi:hypothetical protein